MGLYYYLKVAKATNSGWKSWNFFDKRSSENFTIVAELSKQFISIMAPWIWMLPGLNIHSLP